MARYKVLEPSYIGGSLRKPGDIVDLEFSDPFGRPGPNLEALDAPPPEKPKDIFDNLVGDEHAKRAARVDALVDSLAE